MSAIENRRMRIPEISERAAETLAALEDAAASAGFFVSADGRVCESDAADLLGIAAKTLRNWRATTAPIPWHRIGGDRGRVTYRLRDLAEHIERGRSKK